MGYGILPYMISIDQMSTIWGSGISITKGLSRSQMNQKIGFNFLAKELSTQMLSAFNKEIKKEHGINDFRAHVAMQDLFNAKISYTTIPWIYSYLLKGIANELSLQYVRVIIQDFKQNYPEIPTISEDRRGPSESLKNYIYSRTLLKTWISSLSGQLPNDQWYPCHLSIIDTLPYSTPMPIPQPDDFPYISTIRCNELMDVFRKIEDGDFPNQSKEQMLSWFNLCIQEKRDIMLFIV